MLEIIRNVFTEESHIKLLIAVLLGGLLGVERQKHGRAAGLRTHILVCLASTVLVVIVTYINLYWEASKSLRLDPTRLATGIMTGIGFIGAGTIIRSSTYIRGLTTAASVWLTAALGIVIGLGYYELAIKTTVVAVLALIGLNKVDELIRTEKFVLITIKIRSTENFLRDLKKLCRDKGAKILDVHFYRNKKTLLEIYKLHIKFRHKIDTEYLLEKILALPDVEAVSWKGY